ncbi:MAG: class II fructose-bisphosphatase [Anaerolineaceae bacterium]|nr:class II fructose-bisphosphatase [Anaerolineaceae bacterium]MBN2677120.1 class II fructose-bisphosphatase [Anaerolineaceae bacterium]
MTLPSRNLALELVRVTEAAAMTAGRFMGRGDKIAADKAAVDAMRIILNTIEMSAVVVLGEGEKDKAPMLFQGEHLGAGGPPEVDLAVDPIDGTRPLALGLSNAIATVAVAPRGTMFNPGPIVYMHKIAVGPVARDVIDIEAPVAENLKKIAKAKGEDVEHLTAVILDRPRHKDLIAEVRKSGSRIKLIPDGDVAGALMTAWPQSEIDVLLGIGGTPEGVLAACGLRAMGGNIQGILYARDEAEYKRGRDLGYDFHKVLHIDELVSSENVFLAATGITRGDLLDGVSYFADSVRTDSLVMRGLTGTVRQIISTHQLEKLGKISQIIY